MRVFLDANVLFSGALPNSRMHALFMLLFARAHCVTNAYALSEARRNLEIKFPGSIPVLEALVQRCSVSIVLLGEVPVALKPKDRPILAGAIAALATHQKSLTRLPESVGGSRPIALRGQVGYNSS